MILPLLLAAALPFAESKTLGLQIALDRRGYAVGTIDGQGGRRTAAALARYCADRGLPAPGVETPERSFDRLFASDSQRLTTVTVTERDLAALVRIPADPADKAKLERLGYESVAEAFAERGHLSVRALARLNPHVDFAKPVPAGTRLLIPDVPDFAADLRPATGKAVAVKLTVSLSAFEIRAFDAAGGCLGLFPCSIARDKAKLPPEGELKITSRIAWPNYTYTPDVAIKNGVRQSRQVLPSGPNCPVGAVWIGLASTGTDTLAGYGIHGTPTPETIGRAESHGCFRLTNWDAARLHALCREGVTRVFVTK